MAEAPYQVNDLMGYDGLKIVQREDMFAFSLDAVLLADFTHVYKKTDVIMDFGTGNAPIPLFLSLKTGKPIIGVEIQPEAVDLARRSVALNHLESQIQIVEADIRELHKAYESSSVDLITCNPPFFKVAPDGGNTNASEAFTIARHEVKIDLETIIVQAKRLLSTLGVLAMIHRVDRLEELIVLLNRHKFAIKRLRFVYPKQGRPAQAVLIEAFSNGKPGGVRMPDPLYVYGADGAYTEEVLRIFRIGKK
jgi:tRNA1(Val) A37 N6-methylase TrmN6